jgi:putative ABC transport system permease protein
MLKHLFKLIWNKKKQNFLLLSEIFVSFLVIFAVFSFLVFYYQNYNSPLGFDYKQVWSISYDGSRLTKNTDTLNTFYTNLRKSLKAMPEIEDVSYSSSNFAYSNSMSSTGLTMNGKKYNRILSFVVDDNYPKVWGMQLIAGRWFNTEDAVSTQKHVVINLKLKEAMFGKQDAVGKEMGDYDAKEKMKIIGVVQDIRTDGDYWPAENNLFNRLDTGYLANTSTILLKVKPNTSATFESQLYKFMTNSIKDANIKIEHVDEMRDAKNKVTIIPILIFTIIAAFLIINVALGLFGVLWYNINRRKGEIGLRRAIGASGSAVSFQLVSEALILATLSLIVGCFFAVQFPLLSVFDVPSSVYLIAMLLAIAFIYLLVFACSLYPGKQAAGIHPAVALHEE